MLGKPLHPFFKRSLLNKLYFGFPCKPLRVPIQFSLKMILCSIIPVARSGANWRRARFAAQFVRCIMGAPQVSALSMHADSEEVSRRCSDFLQICRQHGGEGTVDLTISNTVAEVKLNNWDRRNALSGV